MSLAIIEEAPALDTFVSNREQARAAERETAKIRKDPHRRRRYLSHVRSDHSIIRSALATLEALLEHSDDTAGRVWPSQARLARLAGIDVRTVQRHLKELRDAGYLLVYVYAPVRDEATGKYVRRKTNRYYFTFCASPGSGHRVRRNRMSHLHDTDDVSNPSSRRNHRPLGAGGGSPGLVVENRKQKGAPLARQLPLPSGSWNDQKGCELCDFTRWVEDNAGFMHACTCSTTT